MKNENNPATGIMSNDVKQRKSMDRGVENEVVRKDGIKAEQHSLMTDANDQRSMNASLPKLTRRRDIF